MNFRMKINKKNVAFFSAYGLWLINSIILESSMYSLIVPSIFSKIIRICIIILLVIKIIFYTEYAKKVIIFIMTLLVVGLLSGYFSTEKAIIEIILFVVASHNVDFYKIVKFTLISLIILVGFVISSSTLGIIENRVYMRNTGEVRQSIGFIYTGFVNMFFIHIILLLFYIKEKYIRWVEIIFILLVNYMLYKLTDTRTDYYLVYLLIILFICSYKLNILRFEKKIWKCIGILVVPLCALISFIICYKYDSSNTFYYNLNKILTGRIEITKMMIDKVNLSLFGKEFIMIGSAAIENSGYDVSMYSYVDNSYIQIALKYGIIFLGITCISFSKLFTNALKVRNKIICIWIFIIAVESMIYPNLISFQYNVLFLSIFSNINKSESEVSSDG